jgi:hypothetical protein
MNEQYEKGIEYARKGIGFLTSFRMQMGSDSARQQVGGQLWHDLLLEQNQYPRLPEDASVAGRQVASYKPAPTLKAAQVQALAGEFTFISYGIDNNAAMAIVLTHDSLNVVELPGVAERILRDAIGKFRKGLGLETGIQRESKTQRRR